MVAGLETITSGNIAIDGCVVKTSGVDESSWIFEGPAHICESQEDAVEDILEGRPGQYRIRFKDNRHRWDTTYPGVEVLPDGTFVTTTYGHWDKGEEPYILSVRFRLQQLDSLVLEP